MFMLRLLWRQRALISVLVRRDLEARYRASTLGFLWSLLNPLILLIIYGVVFTTIFQPRFPGGDPYPLFLFAGLLPWLFFSGTVLDASSTLIDNGPLLAKVMCPPEIFPAVTVVSHLVHHVFALPALLGALLVCSVFGWHPFPWTVVLLPIVILPWILVGAGAAYAVSSLSVHFRDVRDLAAHILNMLFFASPIIYGLDGLDVPAPMHLALRLNPMACLVEVYRDAAFAGQIAPWWQWAVAFGFGLCAWIVGALIFDHFRETIVEAV